MNLSLNSAKFSKGMTEAQKTLKTARRQFLAVAGAAAAMGAAISTAALKGGQEIDKSAKAARRLGSSIGGFRALELAADEAGVSLSSLTNDVQTIDREIASIGKSGNAQRALDALGLSIDDLAGKDADEKLATIADRVKALGLSTGETTSILRDLGVRNREMVLLVTQGGDALRQARRDIEEYGLALSQTDSAAIEQANDRMSRLGLISQYLRQRLAVELVPAMGEFAQAMTDSLREGGRLRAVIDGLVDNLGRLATWAATAVGLFGARFVAALVAAKVATMSLSGALVFLKGAIARTGIGLLIVGAGELVYQFGRLVTATGGFGEAMGFLADVAGDVWDRIKRGGALLVETFQGWGLSIRAAFTSAFAGVIEDFAAMTGALADGWNSLMGMMGIETNASGLGAELADGLRQDADYLSKSAKAFNDSIAQSWRDLFTEPLPSVEALRAKVAETTAEIENGGDAASRLGDELEGAGSRGRSGLERVKDAASEAGDRLAGIFSGALKGAKSFSDWLSRILDQLADMLIDSAFQSLFSGISGGGIIGAILGSAKGNVFRGGAPVMAFANGGVVSGPTTFPMRGGVGLMGEAGPEAIMPLARDAGGRLGVRSQGGGVVEVVARVENGSIVQDVRRISGEVAVQTVREGLAAYDRMALPGSVNRIRNDPTRRG